jgi:hypothetical protein
VDHPIRHGGSTAQAFQIFKITSMYLGTRGDKRLGARIGASKAEHLMTSADEFLNDGRTDKTCSTRDEDTHNDFSFFGGHDRICGAVGIKMEMEEIRSS